MFSALLFNLSSLVCFHCSCYRCVLQSGNTRGFPGKDRQGMLRIVKWRLDGFNCRCSWHFQCQEHCSIGRMACHQIWKLLDEVIIHSNVSLNEQCKYQWFSWTARLLGLVAAQQTQQGASTAGWKHKKVKEI